METTKGIPVSPGISIASVVVLRADDLRIHHRFISKEQVESEVRRFERATRRAARDLDEQIESVRSYIVHEEVAAVQEIAEKLCAGARSRRAECRKGWSPAPAVARKEAAAVRDTW